jgi:hypothetical protein
MEKDEELGGLEKITLDDLIDMCQKCDWCYTGKCKGIRKDSIQERIVVIKSKHFAIIGEVLSIPRCPKMIHTDPTLN